MIVGVKSVVCTCGQQMRRTGGSFGGNPPSQDTYYCSLCQKHVVVVTPNQDDQEEFVRELEGPTR